MTVAEEEQPEPQNIFSLSLSLVTGKGTAFGGPDCIRARGVVDITWWHCTGTGQDSTADATGEAGSAPNENKQIRPGNHTPPGKKKEKRSVARQESSPATNGPGVPRHARRGRDRRRVWSCWEEPGRGDLGGGAVGGIICRTGRGVSGKLAPLGGMERERERAPPLNAASPRDERQDAG
jgi:hypothetical protein